MATEKWADYGIRKKRKVGTRITHVLAKPDKGDTFGSDIELTKSEVINRMNNGKTFCTILWNSEKKLWGFGSMVRKFTTKNGTFLRTDPNNTEEDNLGELPDF